MMLNFHLLAASNFVKCAPIDCDVVLIYHLHCVMLINKTASNACTPHVSITSRCTTAFENNPSQYVSSYTAY